MTTLCIEFDRDAESNDLSGGEPEVARLEYAPRFTFYGGAYSSPQIPASEGIVLQEAMAFIGDVGNIDGIRIVRPFRITIDQLGDENFVASFPEGNVNASGDTLDEAINNWKDVLRFKLSHYSTFAPAKMTPSARQHFLAMQRHIERT